MGTAGAGSGGRTGTGGASSGGDTSNGGDTGSGGDGAPVPLDSFSILFAKMDMLYTVARTGEMVETTFDFGGNAAG